MYSMLTRFSFPETTKKTLEEVAGVFGDDVAVNIDEANAEVDLREIQQYDEKNMTAKSEHVEQH
jgi:hypothetical protein